MNKKWQHSQSRKKNRLDEFNYSDEEFYFVTICTKDKVNLFGTIQEERMILNEWGAIAEECWRKIPCHFKNVKIGAFIVMPNHIHGIIKIGDPFSCRGRRSASPTDRTKMLLPQIIQQFKSTVTRKIHLLNPDTSFQWQRSYYDHIIRTEKSFEQIQEYIQINPEQWTKDDLFND